MKTRLSKLMAIISVPLIALAVAAPAGAATVSGDYTANGVRIRSGTGLKGTTVLGEGFIGQGLTAYCEEWNYAENNGDWFYHRNNTTKIKGYSLGDYIYTKGQPTHGCSV